MIEYLQQCCNNIQYLVRSQITKSQINETKNTVGEIVILTTQIMFLTESRGLKNINRRKEWMEECTRVKASWSENKMLVFLQLVVSSVFFIFNFISWSWSPSRDMGFIWGWSGGGWTTRPYHTIPYHMWYEVYLRLGRWWLNHTTDTHLHSRVGMRGGYWGGTL